jgi:hypothetical protein
VDYIARLKIRGSDFAKLTKEALEAEYGGEGNALLSGFSQGTLEDTEKFATELYKVFGTGALQYYVAIVKYADSGKFHLEEEAEEKTEEQELESMVNEIESDSDQESETDLQS